MPPDKPLSAINVRSHTESGCQSKNPQRPAWGYTDEARLRGLKAKTDFFLQPDLGSLLD
ncbi:hypothetical protein Oscil6304_5330 [Oscillatoria acuminata PCC 6304]|uniref:Uncharacterized protein n=1 Tax=Oscillatoria acuminata PCC 6304 TaxID=56110 RepID=K9TS65_9CYAN|nr:hypothetical protein Oscil6304_5330 [Oscillatoria acuminata PCC 6304]